MYLLCNRDIACLLVQPNFVRGHGLNCLRLPHLIYGPDERAGTISIHYEIDAKFGQCVSILRR